MERSSTCICSKLLLQSNHHQNPACTEKKQGTIWALKQQWLEKILLVWWESLGTAQVCLRSRL